MKIICEFDDVILNKYEHRGASAFFTVFFEEDGQAYPSGSWMDFGCTILGWWLMSTIRLTNGESPQEFYFMDGPFSLKIEIGNDRQTLTCSNAKEGICWAISFNEFIDEIAKAANTVIRHLAYVGIDEKGRQSLQTGLDMLTERRRQVFPHH